MLREIEFMKQLGYNPHILNIIGAHTIGCADNPLLILEYCANGSLLSHLRSGVGPRRQSVDSSDIPPPPSYSDISTEYAGASSMGTGEQHSPHLQRKLHPTEAMTEEQERRFFLKLAWQISDALVYLAGKGYIHRDVAARNVLLTAEMDAKLSDFGLCRYSAEAFYTTQGGRLPIKWTAPEALNKAEFSPKSDVWSYGVLLFEIFSHGKPPYEHVQAADMLQHLAGGARLERPERCPEEV